MPQDVAGAGSSSGGGGGVGGGGSGSAVGGVAGGMNGSGNGATAVQNQRSEIEGKDVHASHMSNNSHNELNIRF